MATYFATPTLAGTSTAYIGAIATALVAAGWTVADTISGTDVCYRSPDLIAGSGVYFFIRLKDAGTVNIVAMLDHDNATHADIVPSGVISGGGGPAPAGKMYIYANALGFTYCVFDGLYNPFVWAGQPRTRQLQGKTDGLCLSTAGMSIGATSVAVSADMTSRFYVGQPIAIQNFAHNSASANASNYERVTITGVTASTLSFTATTKAYDSGAKIGSPDMLWPIGGLTFGQVNAYNGSGLLSCGEQCIDMGQSGSNTQTTMNFGAGVQSSTGILANMNNAYTIGMATDSFVPLAYSAAASGTALGQPAWGFLMAAIPWSTTPVVDTKYTDGTNVWIQPAHAATGGGMMMLMGPTGDAPNFATQTRILQPTIDPGDSFYTFINKNSPPPSAFNQGLN